MLKTSPVTASPVSKFKVQSLEAKCVQMKFNYAQVCHYKLWTEEQKKGTPHSHPLQHHHCPPLALITTWVFFNKHLAIIVELTHRWSFYQPFMNLVLQTQLCFADILYSIHGMIINRSMLHLFYLQVINLYIQYTKTSRMI